MRFLKFAVIIMAALFAARAQAGTTTVEVKLALDKNSNAATIFSANVPKIYAFFTTKGTRAGDKLRSVWIAEDVGDAAPPNYKIDEASLTADKDDFYGAFSMDKPINGWALGKYRVEIYNGDELVATAKFTVKKDAKAKDEGEKEKKEAESDDSNDD